MNSALPVIALTIGEPAGIGPDIILQLTRHPLSANIVVIGSRLLLQERAQQLNIPFQAIDYHPGSVAKHSLGQLVIWDIPLPEKTIIGQPNPKHAAHILKTLELAATGCLNQTFHAMVTAPIHKANINQSGITFSGHTEYLAQLTQTKEVVMMLMTKSLRIALVTTHIPLSQVASHITEKRLMRTFEIVHHELQKKFAIPQPKILVCGLNPHAGEEGHLGREEIDIIQPTILMAQKKGLNLIGPVAADTAFTPQSLSQIDAVITMYHDQGLPVLKYAGFGHAINITLGLPIIRTSVDHGTALAIAGTGKADASSLLAAIDTAIHLK